MFESLGSGPHYADPGADVVFGDVFHAPFLRDIFAREDTALLGGGPLPAKLASRVGSWMHATLRQDEDIDLFSPAFAPKEQTRYALAHATFLPEDKRLFAIVISDSCLISTALVQGRHKRSVGGRLLFAPIRVVDEEKWQRLADAEDFERFPLVNDERFPSGAVAELSCCFMVDARDVKKHGDSRVASLGRELAEELEVHWNAYAARRGPRAYGRSTLKLASLLSGGGPPRADAEQVANAVADVLDVTWVVEGSDLEDVSEAEEAVRLAGGSASALTPPLVGRLADHLRELAELAAAAANKLDAHR